MIAEELLPWAQLEVQSSTQLKGSEMPLLLVVCGFCAQSTAYCIFRQVFPNTL